MAAMNNQLLYYSVQDGNGNAQRFCQFIDELADECQHQQLLNCTVIMDNVSFHRTALVRDRLETRGFQIQYLPPYSPFFNPTENLLSQWKSYVRRDRPDNEEQLVDAIEHVYMHVTW